MVACACGEAMTGGPARPPAGGEEQTSRKNKGNSREHSGTAESPGHTDDICHPGGIADDSRPASRCVSAADAAIVTPLQHASPHFVKCYASGADIGMARPGT